MKEILVSNTYAVRNVCVYEFDWRCDEFKVWVNVYTNKDFNQFLLHMHVSAECQCKREGDSFFLFDTFDKLKEFIETDSDFGGLSTQEHFINRFTIKQFESELLW